MTGRIHSRGWARLALAAVVAAGMTVATALPAAAAGDFTFDFDTPKSKTVEYGEQWFFEASGAFNGNCYCTSRIVLIDAKTNSAMASTKERFYPDDATFTTTVYPFGYKLGFLDAGDYSFKLRLEQDANQKATTDSAVSLTIAPAKLTTQLRATADPNNPANVVLTVLTSGRFVQEIDYSQSGYSALMPAGTWKITATDPNGEVVFTDEATQEEGTQSSFSSYWAGPPAATTLKFEGEFTPSGAVASNFSVEPASPISLSTPKADDEVVVVPGEGEEPAEPVAAASVDPTLPAWALWALSALIVALAAATIVMAIRLRRPKAVTA